MDNIKKKVREEKREFEELEKEQERLESQTNLVPYTKIKSGVVKQLLKSYYDPEQLKNIKIPEDRIPQLVRSLRTLNKNYIRYSSPMICKGPKCPLKRCPMQIAGIAPIGSSCPIELMLVDQWEKEYIDDLDVDSQSKVELDMVRDMIEADLIDWRASHEIAEDGLFDWVAVGVSEKGKPVLQKTESISLGLKLKFKARKDRLREDLMATRKIRAKHGLIKNDDPSKHAADLNKRFKEIQDAEITDGQ